MLWLWRQKQGWQEADLILQSAIVDPVLCQGVPQRKLLGFIWQISTIFQVLTRHAKCCNTVQVL